MTYARGSDWGLSVYRSGVVGSGATQSLIHQSELPRFLFDPEKGDDE